MASHNYTNRNKNIRNKSPRKRPPQKSNGAFKWMLITGLLIGLVVFAVYLKGNGLKKLKQHLPQNRIAMPVVQASKPEISAGLSPETVEKLEQQPDSLPPEVATELENGTMPQFDFYTILQEKEVVVPEHEIMTRTHAERANPPDETLTDTTAPVIPAETPTKSTIAYMMQAGSFKNGIDAEKMRTNLESMGIEARVERAKVGEVIWHRIKMGPYTQMTSVSAIRARLRQSGIDVIVTEIGVR
ncbi:MAG: SPOR domain-containing protein [Methylococcales bacterium]|nr:SPOR domain-containing protein [Methylococcales bacterium]MDD5754151.1 SPOR domain-containing protein [Methylococcales bacterium]